MRDYNHTLDIDERAAPPPAKSDVTKAKRSRVDDDLPEVTDVYMEESWRTGNINKVGHQTAACMRGVKANNRSPRR